MMELLDAVRKATLHPGANATIIPELRLYRLEDELSRKPLIYDPTLSGEPCFCVIVKGRKRVYLQDESFAYDPANYLVLSTAAPVEIEQFATPEDPLLGFTVEINRLFLNEVLNQIQQPGIPEEPPRALGPSRLTQPLADAFLRLLHSAQDPAAAALLSPGILKEIHYHALQGEQQPLLRAIAGENSRFSRVAEVLKQFQTGYSRKYTLEDIASIARMSISSLHRAFREVTSDSPIHYLKMIRLHKAKELLTAAELPAYLVAEQVGYESVSQFSREFKHAFGISPGRFRTAARS